MAMRQQAVPCGNMRVSIILLRKPHKLQVSQHCKRIFRRSLSDITDLQAPIPRFASTTWAVTARTARSATTAGAYYFATELSLSADEIKQYVSTHRAAGRRRACP